jgi:hypothetical protein
VNKPLFIVNGGRDPMYPTSVVDPYVEHLKKGGVDLVYRPQPEAAHDTSWWPEIKDSFERSWPIIHASAAGRADWESGPPNCRAGRTGWSSSASAPSGRTSRRCPT